MKTLKFKTNIKCSGCVAKGTPYLNGEEEIAGKWQVDIVNPDKILTVEKGKTPIAQIKEAVQKAGFAIEQI